MARGQIASKTKYQMQMYLAARVTNERSSEKKARLRDWISSVLSASEITEDEVRACLIFFYSTIRRDERVLEVLQNENITYMSPSKEELYTNIDDIPGTAQKISFKD